MPVARTSPVAAACTYHVLKAVDSTFKLHLRGVLGDAVLQSQINGGFAALQLDLDHYPAELTIGDLVSVQDPNGVELGRWKFEQREAAWDEQKNSFQVTLTPLVAELSDVKDWNANYTTDATQVGTPLNPADPQVWCQAAVAQTKHLTQGTILAIGTAYAYAFNNTSPKAAFDQAIFYGSLGWWWFCDGLGTCDLRNTSPYTHLVTAGRDVTVGKLTEDWTAVVNAQTVQGATPAGMTAPLTATATDTNPGNPLSIPNIGRRSGRLYSDASINDLSSVTALATRLLAQQERLVPTRSVTLTNYTVRRPRCGDAMKLRAPSPDPTTGQYAVLGPYLVVAVKEYPATSSYEIDLLDYATPVVDQGGYTLSKDLVQSVLNPQASGFATGPGGTPVSAGQLTGAPNAPTGLALSSYIENSAQVENAAVTASWSAPATDSTHTAATAYQVQYRRTGTTPWINAPVTGALTLTITGLVQGTSYDVQVAAMNAAGISAYTALSTVTTAQASTPAAPGQPTQQAGVSTVVITWNLLTANDIQLYEVWQFTGASTAASPPGGSVLAWQGETAIATIGGLTSNQTYTFWVRAKNWSGILGSYSPYVQGTPRYVGNADIAAASIVVDKLAAGTLTAGVVLSGYIQTAATVDSTHSGVKIDGTSIKVYDGTGTNWGAPSGAGVACELNPSGAFFKGTVRGSLIQGPSGSPGGTAFLEIDMTTQTGLKLRVNDGTYDRVQVGFYV